MNYLQIDWRSAHSPRPVTDHSVTASFLSGNLNEMHVLEAFRYEPAHIIKWLLKPVVNSVKYKNLRGSHLS